MVQPMQCLFQFGNGQGVFTASVITCLKGVKSVQNNGDQVLMMTAIYAVLLDRPLLEMNNSEWRVVVLNIRYKVLVTSTPERGFVQHMNLSKSVWDNGWKDHFISPLSCNSAEPDLVESDDR